MSASFSAADQRWLAAIESLATPPPLLDEVVPLGLRSRRVDGPAAPHGLARHVATFGLRPSAAGVAGRDLLAALEHQGLTGHGGGHFPAARKWHAAIGAGGAHVVVANGAEGEPASAKDATLLQLRPHLVLDGLELTAEAVGARQAVLWLHRGDDETLSSVARALAERRASRGEAIAVRVVEGPDRYLTGESSAVVRALSGGPALPAFRTRPAATAGVDGRPTLVHNVETLAQVAVTARALPLGEEVGQWSGPLVTVVGPQRRSVLLVQPGETFADVVRRSGTAAADPPQAALVGGYGGTWVPWSVLASTEVSVPALHRVGASLGAGVIAPIGARTCPLVETAAILRFLAASSARQCGPCLFGLPALADLFDRLARGRCTAGDVRDLRRYAVQVTGRGACHHPDGATRLVQSALDVFADDVRRHQSRSRCPGADRRARFPMPEAI